MKGNPMNIDLNCDLGEGFPHDEELMTLITSANICCAAHAGDEATSLAALRCAARSNVQVGAHPGFRDREHFGRREQPLSAREIRQECADQIVLLQSLAAQVGVPVRYVKPHGALYNMACREEAIAVPVVEAVAGLNLALVGLPGSFLERCAAGRCLFVAEGFADRRYLPNGSLVPRSQQNSMVEDTQEAVRQAQWLMSERGVRTLCVHGDNPHAVKFVRTLRQALEAQGHQIRPFALS